jgi:hypothetical protein
MRTEVKRGNETIKMCFRDLRALTTLANSAVVEQDTKQIIDCLDKIEAVTMKIRKALED